MQDEFINKILINEKIIHKVINLYCDKESDKNDYYQEILLQSWKSYPNFRGDSKFSTWLYKISLNTVLTLKSKKTITTFDMSRVQDIPSTNENKLESVNQLRIMLNSLNDFDKNIISLYLDGYPLKKIAEMTGITLSNVKVKIHRIKKYLIENYNR
ncbi:sigma-70 family RNA polymerase sigma factor [Weeksellaceae bacterium TAE3-ERU29]|nr:sigma-70 family RNA polymerase sigma factor [Weeksellaceae bacterium TAE3-ERU29]